MFDAHSPSSGLTLCKDGAVGFTLFPEEPGARGEGRSPGVASPAAPVLGDMGLQGPPLLLSPNLSQPRKKSG